MSRLRINNSKSICVPLGPAARATLPENTRFPVLAEHGSCRYLSIQVGVQKQSKANLESFYSSLSFRLSLPTKKTHTVLQRVQLVWALVVPKLCFVAQFDFPDNDTTDSIQRFVWGTSNGKRNHA